MLSLERPGRRWEDKIKIDLKEMCVITRNWVDSALDRDYFIMNATLNIRVA